MRDGGAALVRQARLVPYDLVQMAHYLGAPLERWPGLAVRARRGG